jgi:tricorn protease
MRLEVGDVITAVEGEPIGATDTLEAMLQGRVGKETLFTVRRAVTGGEAKELQLLLTPISFEAEAMLFYNHWRNATARKVDQMSGGKIGYIHIRGMDQNSLDVFERDLYAAADGKQGLIIDVRNNGGGWTADRLLASIMYPRHAYTRPRGVPESVTDAYPQDRLFIQRYNLPINMLCNENSFSNAEIIAHAFKTLKRGTLVGQRTAGGVISTGGTSLIDGTSVRLPFRGWYLPDGKNMELNGAMPDLLVPQTPESEEADEDAQLNAAVEDLIKRLK